MCVYVCIFFSLCVCGAFCCARARARVCAVVSSLLVGCVELTQYVCVCVCVCVYFSLSVCAVHFARARLCSGKLY